MTNPDRAATGRQRRHSVQAWHRAHLIAARTTLPADLPAALRHLAPDRTVLGIHNTPPLDIIVVLLDRDTYTLLPIPHPVRDPDHPACRVRATHLDDAIDDLYTGGLLDIADTLADTIHRCAPQVGLAARYRHHLAGYLTVLPEPDQAIARTHVALRGIEPPQPPTPNP